MSWPVKNLVPDRYYFDIDFNDTKTEGLVITKTVDTGRVFNNFFRTISNRNVRIFV